MFPIGRPGWFTIIPISIGKLYRLASRDINQEEMAAPLIDITSAVQAIPEAIDNTHLGERFAILCLLVQGSHLSHERQPLAIGRPYWSRGTMWQKGELASLTSCCRQEPDLRLIFTQFLLLFTNSPAGFSRALGNKGQVLPIW